jgi:acetyl esterase/lipase
MTGYETETSFDIHYAVHEGVELLGDLYRPAGAQSAPVLVAAHGGAFQFGDRKNYQHWGLTWRGMGMRSFRSSIA